MSFNIGDKVKITDNGGNYTTYKAMATRMSLDKWENESDCPCDIDLEIVAKELHCNGDTTVYAVLHDNKHYLVSDDYMELLPETKPQWGGEGLPPVGVECLFTMPDFETPLEDEKPCEVMMHTDNNGFPVAVVRQFIGDRMVVDFAGSECFTPLETQEQREKREKLEAAYDLYSSFKGVVGVEPLISFAKWSATQPTDAWLTIVEKTGYRVND